MKRRTFISWLSTIPLLTVFPTNSANAKPNFNNPTLIPDTRTFEQMVYNLQHQHIPAIIDHHVLMEYNDHKTRALFVSMLSVYLREYQFKGLVDFWQIDCNELNNTPDVIDSYKFLADVYLRENTYNEWICLQVVVAPNSVLANALQINLKNYS